MSIHPEAIQAALETATDSVHVAKRQRALVNAMRNPACYPHPVEKITLLETHISYVLLTGKFAYKIKKAVKLGFLDFSRLEQRHFYCEEELRLNRRLAPELYLDVVPVHGPMESPQVGRESESRQTIAPLEYAVRMVQFPQASLFDRRLSQGKIQPGDIDTLADRIADFHAQMPQTCAGDDYGSPSRIWQPVAENFSQLRTGNNSALDLALLDTLENWSRKEHARLKNFMDDRQCNGFVRECHGDLHLGNIVLMNGRPTPFDCIEFSPNLRWIDVMSEVAFLMTDLEQRGRADYGYRFLNRYLETTDDYGGLRILKFYRVYRALIRAKVAGIRAGQESAAAAQAQLELRKQYLIRARLTSLPGKPQLLLMHGVSGSGKTWLSQTILERIGAVRLRSDIVRKRLCGLPPLIRSDSPIERGLYDTETTRATYQRLLQLALSILQHGIPVIVDAASLKGWQRRLFRDLGEKHHIPFHIIACETDPPTLHRRILARQQAGNDASEADLAILQHQLQNLEPLTEQEQESSLLFDSEHEALDIFLNRISPQSVS